MKIYILRHEDRTQDASFFGPLTKNGLEKSTKLIEKCEELHINHIYSSPFIRTLQTIYPYSKYKSIPIKLDYALCEIHDQSLIAHNSHGTHLPEYLAQSFNYEDKYKSSIQPEEIKYPETKKDVIVRVRNLLKNIITNHGKTDDRIIIVTHQVVCDNILNMVGKLKKHNIINYPIGSISLIFEDFEWSFKPINWKLKT